MLTNCANFWRQPRWPSVLVVFGQGLLIKASGKTKDRRRGFPSRWCHLYRVDSKLGKRVESTRVTHHRLLGHIQRLRGVSVIKWHEHQPCLHFCPLSIPSCLKRPAHVRGDAAAQATQENAAGRGELRNATVVHKEWIILHSFTDGRKCGLLQFSDLLLCAIFHHTKIGSACPVSLARLRANRCFLGCTWLTWLRAKTPRTFLRHGFPTGKLL